MSELAQRYIRRKAQAAAEEENVHDIDDLRSEINEIKEMLRKFNSANNCNRNSM